MNLTVTLCCAVSSAEDPEKLLDQAVTDLQNDVIKMRQASAQVWIAVTTISCQVLTPL